MVRAVDIEAELANLSVLDGRSRDTPPEAQNNAFATLAEFGSGGVSVGSFVGDSPWERHRQGDELVHILKGRAVVTILHESGETELELSAGMLTVVPQGLWHRFHAPNGVTVLTVTPYPTDHSAADDPRQE